MKCKVLLKTFFRRDHFKLTDRETNRNGHSRLSSFSVCLGKQTSSGGTWNTFFLSHISRYFCNKEYTRRTRIWFLIDINRQTDEARDQDCPWNRTLTRRCASSMLLEMGWKVSSDPREDIFWGWNNRPTSARPRGYGFPYGRGDNDRQTFPYMYNWKGRRRVGVGYAT